MVAAARSLLSTLRPELERECLFALDDANRVEWGYVPGKRRGVSLKQMNEAERRATHALLRAGLSGRGYDKAAGVMELEGILGRLETFGSGRDPELYWIALFGEPSETKPWGWRFEGHHLSLNFSSATGRIVATTPAFFGANPARVPSGRRAGWRVLAGEEDLARKLLASLDENERHAAMPGDRAPADIILGPDRKETPTPSGLAASQMRPEPRALLLELVGEYLDNMRPEVSRAQRQRIEAAGVEKIRFLWAGGAKPGEPHYYRVQGPTFVVEYDNTQNHANHVHSVWRDLENDFGGDLLRRHYAESPHHRGHRPRSS